MAPNGEINDPEDENRGIEDPAVRMAVATPNVDEVHDVDELVDFERQAVAPAEPAEAQR